MFFSASFLKRNNRLLQYLATFAGSFSVISCGINLGWSSHYLPKLIADDSEIPTSSDEGSWCAVAPLIGAPFGAILAAVLADRIGRKYTTLLATPILIIPLLIVAFAKSIMLISIVRFIVGTAQGILYTVLPMYIAEIAEPQIRGFLTSTISLALIVGTLFINIIGPMTSIFLSSMICLGIPLIHFCTFIWMPESPYYHLKKQKCFEAKESLKMLRGTTDVDEELDSLCVAVARQENCKSAKITDLVTVPSNRKACFIYMIAVTTNKFSGKNPCLFYTETIFEESGSSIDSHLAVIIYSCVEFFATASAIILVDKFGKRPLLITSSFGSFVSVFFLGTHFYLKAFYPELSANLGWLPITALVAYNILFSIGLAFGAVAIIGELFPTNIKATALCIGEAVSVILGALASKFFQITKDSYGMYVPFWCFSTCSVIGLIFIIKYVPETKGKTLEEIQQYLIGDESLEPKKKIIT